VVHPFICSHPITQDPTLCFHCGEPFVETFAVDYKPPDNYTDLYDWDKTLKLLKELKAYLEAPTRLYQHNWELGDFAIIDNLAVAHYAHPDTQADPNKDGLRVLHRTTVAGETAPAKRPVVS